MTAQAPGLASEQSWYFKPGRARFDFTSTHGGQSLAASLFALPDGTFLCLGSGPQARCASVSSVEVALRENPAALYHESLTAHPERFRSVAVGARHIAGQHAYCYDVHPLAGGLSDGRFCFSAEGVPLFSRALFGMGEWSAEATSVLFFVPDSALTLPARPVPVDQP